jgi:hypothetical protein
VIIAAGQNDGLDAPLGRKGVIDCSLQGAAGRDNVRARIPRRYRR